jgi:hypothetical protein
MATTRCERYRPIFSYRQEIVAVLCLKAVGLGLLFFLFFAPSGRPTITQQTVANHLLAVPGSPADSEARHDR